MSEEINDNKIAEVKHQKHKIAYQKNLIRRPLLLGYLIILIFILGFGTLFSMIDIHGAVVATGQVVNKTGVKTIQHPDGGIIAKLLVNEGDYVQKNQLLIHLDDVQTRANLNVISEQLIKLQAVRLRLVRERDNQIMVLPSQLNDNEKSAYIIELEQFEVRKKNIDFEKSILSKKIIQYEVMIKGFQVEVVSIDDTLKIANRELTIENSLQSKGMASITKGLVLGREIATLTGRKGLRVADIAKISDQILETQLQLQKIDVEFRAQVIKELAEVEAHIRENLEKRIAALDKLKRTEIISPEEGYVQNLTVFTVNETLRGSEPIMHLVPKQDKLVVDSRIMAQNIDQIRVGQDASIRFTNFNRRMTPELRAKVEVVSADLSTNTINPNRQTAKDMIPFYIVRLAINEGEATKLGQSSMQAGMQVEVLIMTDERTILSYLFKPLFDRTALALRER